MSKHDLVTFCISHPLADASDRRLVRKLSGTRKRTAKLALVNMARRLSRS